MPPLTAAYDPGSGSNATTNPNEQLGFEIDPLNVDWSFAPEFYPDDFTQMKKKELSRYGGNCGGESVSIKSIKNREFHVTGVMLRQEIMTFHALLDHEGQVDLLSPLIPGGGMECYLKKGELGNEKGWDPHTKQRYFGFTLDLVSTGRDETDSGDNAIVTAIMGNDPTGTEQTDASDNPSINDN